MELPHPLDRPHVSGVQVSHSEAVVRWSSQEETPLASADWRTLALLVPKGHQGLLVFLVNRVSPERKESLVTMLKTSRTPQPRDASLAQLDPQERLDLRANRVSVVCEV